MVKFISLLTVLMLLTGCPPRHHHKPQPTKQEKKQESRHGDRYVDNREDNRR